MKRSGTYVLPAYKRERTTTVVVPTRATTVRMRRARTVRPTRGRFTAGEADELKFFDTALSFTVDRTAEVPATGQLVLIPQGVTDETRVGRKCVIKSVQIRGVLTYAPGADALATTTIHIWLVQDTQTNGAAAAITDVFTSNSAESCLRNLDNSDRFRILKHWPFSFKPQAGVAAAFNTDREIWDYYARCSIPMDYGPATDGTIGSIRTNNLFLMAGCDAGGDDNVTVTGACRVRFSDS